MELLPWDSLAWVKCSPSPLCPWDECSPEAWRGSRGCSPAELIGTLFWVGETEPCGNSHQPFPLSPRASLHPSFPTMGVAAAQAEQPFEHSGDKTSLLSQSHPLRQRGEGAAGCCTCPGLASSQHALRSCAWHCAGIAHVPEWVKAPPDSWGAARKAAER